MEINVLQHKSADLIEALIGQGASGGDILAATRTEMGQMMGRVGDAVGPRTKDAQNKKIEREVKRQLTILPQRSNLDEMESEKYAEFTWLYAAPTVLFGINDEDKQRGASTEAAFQMFRAGQHGRDRGDAYVPLGRRGKQKVMRLNRVQVSKAAFKGVVDILRNKQGQLRAACYRIAAHYVPTKRVPAWLRDKFATVEANGKSQIQETILDAHGNITAIIKSPGVQSNDRLVEKFRGAIKKSQYILEEKTRKILRGYKYAWETGQVFRQRDAGPNDEN